MYKSCFFLFLMLFTHFNLFGNQNEVYVGVITNAQAINVSGKQRMLTQRMAKSFLALVEGVNESSAKTQKIKSMLLFEEGQRILKNYTANPKVVQKINIVEDLYSNYKDLLNGEYTDKNARQVLAINSDVLTATNDVVLAIEESLSSTVENQVKDEKLLEVINVSGRQRMLSQRFSMFYIAYYAGIDKKYDQLDAVYTLFDDSLTHLIASSLNTNEIDNQLMDVVLLWRKVRDQYSSIKAKNVDPTLLYNDMDVILSKMNDITADYTALKSL